jgi:hypothetical protein
MHMKKLLTQLGGLLLLLCAVQSAAAQGMMVSDAISIRNDYGYELIGRLRDRILLFRDKYNDFEVQAFDNSMRLSWARELEDLDSRGIQVIAVTGGRNDFSIVHKQRKRAHAVLRLHKYDPGAKLIDSMVLKDYGDRPFDLPMLEFVRSEDRNCIAVYNVASRQQIEVTCFLLDKMQVLWDKTVALEEEWTEEQLPHIELSNNGELFIITEKNNRRNRLEDHHFDVLRLNGALAEHQRVPAPNFLSTSARFRYDNARNVLVGTGLYAEKNRERSNGVFFMRLSPGRAAEQAIQYEPFDDKFLSILKQKNVEDDNRGIGDTEVRDIVLRQDGGALMVVERSHEVMRGASAGRGFWREGMRFVVDYYYDDFFVVAFQPDGRPQWKTVLHKKQYSQDDEGTFSSFFLFRSADKIRFLFNDEIKYENTCSEYVVTPLGDFDRNSLLSTEDQSLRLRFRDALQLNAGECLVPSEFRNKLRLVLLRW